MNDNNIFENAFNNIDDELIAEAKSPTIRIAARRKKIIISTIAACIAAVLVTIPSVKVISDLNDNKFTTSDDIEIIVQEQIIEQIQSKPAQNESQGTNSTLDNSNISSGTTGIQSQGGTTSADGSYGEITIAVDDLYFTNISTHGTTTYEKVYAPNTKYLYINPIPTDKYITIYEGYYQKEIDQNEAQALADKYFPKIESALDLPKCEYTIDIDKSGIPKISIQNKVQDFHYTKFYDISFSVTNMQNRNIVTFYDSINPLTINGEAFSTNQNQSDTEIINSISGLKQKLFDLFEISFDSTKIIRHYDGYSNHGAKTISIILYNSNAHILNNLYSDSPYTDFISIEFDDYDNKSTDIYYASDIDYWSFRTENKSHSRPIAQKELQPLEKAEEYLSKGYVLSMGGCAFCQAKQSPVDFTNYDYVSLEYKGGFNVGVLAIPYYVFYKNIGTAENGNMTFAETYVPAVEVEGYEEYFVNKHNNHKQNSNSDDYILEDNGE